MYDVIFIDKYVNACIYLCVCRLSTYGERKRDTYTYTYTYTHTLRNA